MSENITENTDVPCLPPIDGDVADFEKGMISVIIPNYNRAELVLEALSSVAKQTYRNFEILLVDDGSTDGTHEAVEAWVLANRFIDIRLIHQDNSGPAAARNTGVMASSGEFVLFLDSDDLFFPSALQILLDHFQGSEAPYILANIHNSDVHGNIFSWNVDGVSKQSETNYFRSRWMTHAALYRRSTLQRSGLFNERLRRGEDREFQWRISATNGPGQLIDEYIGLRRQHDQGHLSVNKPSSEAVAQSIASLSAFADWLETTNHPSQRVTTAALASIVGRGIQSGQAGAMDLKAQAFALPARLSRKDFLHYRLIRLLGKPSSLRYFSLLNLVFDCSKAVCSPGKSILRRILRAGPKSG